MTTDEAERILRKVCPDLTREEKPDTGVTILSGRVPPPRLKSSVGQWFLDVRCYQGRAVSVNHTRVDLLPYLRAMVATRTEQAGVKNPCGAYGKVEAVMGYGPDFDWECVELKVRLWGSGWAESTMFWVGDRLTPELKAFGAAVVESPDSGVHGLIDYLIETQENFSYLWGRATEWAALNPNGKPGPKPVVGLAVEAGHDGEVAASIWRAGGYQLTVGRITMPDDRCPCCKAVVLSDLDRSQVYGGIRHGEDRNLIWVCRDCWVRYTPRGER
jgi:hypothetical protein